MSKEPSPEPGIEEITLDTEGYLSFSPADRDNAKNWSTSRRMLITGIVQAMTLNCSFASTAPTGALPGIIETFHVSTTAANLVTTLFLAGYCAGPLLWAPLSEQYGRRWIYYLTFTAYFAFNFLCAWTPNFGGLLVGRFLTGTFASCALSNGPGVLVDIWGPIQRGNAMAVFMAIVFTGPVVGPITAGFIQLTVGWRWTFYELLWLGAATLLVLPFLPETLPSRRLVLKAKRLRKSNTKYANLLAPIEANGPSLGSVLKRTLLRPFMLLIDPICLFVTLYISLVYAVLYMMFTIYPIIFQEKRGWNAGVGELPLIGLAIGAILGATCIFLASAQMRKKSAGGEWKAERRLPLAMVGAVVLPISMFWLAWSGNYNSVPWIVPTLSGIFFAMAVVFIFASVSAYLADTYLTYAASAVAINTVVRSAAAAAAPLFTEQMFAALGVGGAGSLLAGVACLLGTVPFIFYKYGERVRIRSKWAPTEQERVG